MANTSKILAHTADIRLLISADTLEELFVSALKGLNKLLKADFSKGNAPEININLSLTSADITSLLIDLLSEVLTLSHIHKAVFCQLSIEQLTEHTLKGVLTGCSVSSFDKDVKAVTYHEAEVKKTKQEDGKLL